MRKTVLIAIALYMLCSPVLAAPELSADSAVLICADTGEVLYDKAAGERMLIASLTKIMTAMVVLDNCPLDDQVAVDHRSAGLEGSSAYLKAGESYSVEQLLYGMLLASGNDAATALALHVSGSVSAFAALMNYKARELGLKDSSFRNPTGLDQEGHYSTAADMARLTAYCMKDPVFARIVGTKSYPAGELFYVNHNRLLWSCQGVCGVKTGFTRAAGRALVTCALREGATYICVTLRAPDDWQDHRSMYDWAERSYDYVTVLSRADTVALPLVSGKSGYVRVCPAEDLSVLVPAGEQWELSLQLPDFVFAGVRAGERAGCASVVRDGREIARTDMLYCEDAEIDRGLKLTPAERFSRIWTIAGRDAGKPYYVIGE